MGLQGKGEILDCIPEAQEDFPLPLHQRFRSLADEVGWGRRRRSGCGHVTVDVEMVADEVFCRLRRIARAGREASRCYEFPRQTQHVFLKSLEQRDVALLHQRILR